jgi:protein-disulfide isomerase
MNHRWLTLLVTAFLAAVVFLLFWLRLQPVWTPDKSKETSSTAIITNPTAEPMVTFVNPRKGAAEPKVTLVVFGDFQCQPCKELAENLAAMLKSVPEAQIVWKDLPNESAHELAVPAAVAARCAADQGKFWEYHDVLFDRQVFLTEDSFETIAAELGLDQEKFSACFENQDTMPLIRKDFEEGQTLTITATPTIFIGSERMTGLLSTEELVNWAEEKITTTK